MNYGEEWRIAIDKSIEERLKKLDFMNPDALKQFRDSQSFIVISLNDKLMVERAKLSSIESILTETVLKDDSNLEKIEYQLQREQELFDAIEAKLYPSDKKQPTKHMPTWQKSTASGQQVTASAIPRHLAPSGFLGRKGSSPPKLDVSPQKASSTATGNVTTQGDLPATPTPSIQAASTTSSLTPANSAPSTADQAAFKRYDVRGRNASGAAIMGVRKASEPVAARVHKPFPVSIGQISELIQQAERRGYDADSSKIIAELLFNRDLFLINQVKEATQLTRPTYAREQVQFPLNASNQQKVDAYKLIISVDHEKVNLAKPGEDERWENKTVSDYRKYIGSIFGAATQSSKSCSEFSDLVRAHIWQPKAGVKYDQNNPIPFKDASTVNKQVKMWVDVAKLLWANNDLESLNTIQNLLNEALESSGGKKHINLDAADLHFLKTCREIFTAGGGRYLKEVTKEYQESNQDYIPCIGPINGRLETQESGFKNAMGYTRAQDNKTKQYTETEEQAAANKLDRLAKQMVNTSTTVDGVKNEVQHLPTQFAKKYKEIESINILAAQSQTCRTLKEGISTDIRALTLAVAAKDLPSHEKSEKKELLKTKPTELLEKTLELHELDKKLVSAIEHMQNQLPVLDNRLIDFKLKIAKMKVDALKEIRTSAIELSAHAVGNDKIRYEEDQHQAVMALAKAQSDVHTLETKLYEINMKKLTGENSAMKCKEAFAMTKELQSLETLFKVNKNPPASDIASFSINHKNILDRIQALKNSFGDDNHVQIIANTKPDKPDITLLQAWGALKTASEAKQAKSETQATLSEQNIHKFTQS